MASFFEDKTTLNVDGKEAAVADNKENDSMAAVTAATTADEKGAQKPAESNASEFAPKPIKSNASKPAKLIAPKRIVGKSNEGISKGPAAEVKATRATKVAFGRGVTLATEHERVVNEAKEMRMKKGAVNKRVAKLMAKLKGKTENIQRQMIQQAAIADSNDPPIHFAALFQVMSMLNIWPSSSEVANMDAIAEANRIYKEDLGKWKNSVKEHSEKLEARVEQLEQVLADHDRKLADHDRKLADHDCKLAEQRREFEEMKKMLEDLKKGV